jgi:hypothetical protein
LVPSGASTEHPAPGKADVEMKDDEENKPDEANSDHANGDVADPKEEDQKTNEVPDVDDSEDKTAEDPAPDPKDEDKPAESREEVKPTEAKESTQTTEPKDETKPVETNGNAVEPGARKDEDVPSTILEKGIIYFFYRPRVNVDTPQDVNDVARSFLLLRPLPLDAKLGDGPIGDEKNCRLLALPKKVLPKSAKDRFITFVEKAKTDFAELKETFLTGSEYETQTQGTKTTHPVTPLAEGIYAITSTGRESHLAYIVNIPSELGEVQKDFGLQSRGSFVASVKNPEKGPTGGQQNVPAGAKYPQEIIDDFRELRWAPLTPRLIDYDGASFLLIGEDFEKAMQERPKDERDDKSPPNEELEKLEGEDEIRIKHLKGEMPHLGLKV